MSNNNSGGGIGFVGALTILFVALRLTNFIDWSWWWVLSPIWILTIVLAVLCTILITGKAKGWIR